MATSVDGLVRIGPAGWAYRDWKGIVYPSGMPHNEHPLLLLSQMFDVIEINTTFYRPIAARQSAPWLRHVAANPRFTFTAKLWERYTHLRDDWPSALERDRFLDGLKPLYGAGRLAIVLAQFPWSFRRTPENRYWLARVLDEFADWPLAVELRHSSWEQTQVFERLRERGVALCNIDQPLFQDSIAPAEHVTAPFAYVRLHGRNKEDWFRDGAHRDERYNYLYDRSELEPWIERIRQMRSRAGEVFVITNNHFRGQAVVNALEIQASLGNTQVILPQTLVAEYPRLGGLQA